MPFEAAFIVPHPPLIVAQVGRGNEKQVQKTIDSYREAARQIAALKPETIIISSPHSVLYRDYFHISPGSSAQGSFADFGAPQVRFDESYDTELVKAICEAADAEGFPAGTQGEIDSSLDHGTRVPLYFIEKEYTGFQLVRIGLSGLSLAKHYRLGEIIKQAVEKTGRRCVYVASGDLSHKLREYGPYGFCEQGPVYDKMLMDVCRRGALEELKGFDAQLCEKASECGHRSFVIMSGAMSGSPVTAQVLSHEDITGVGYGVCCFYPKKSDEYVRLAEMTIRYFVKTGELPEMPAQLPKEMLGTQAGAFVSIHKNGQLRGCIGTILPTKNDLAREIMSNAVSAATRDPRFSPITESELDELEINVDVLSEPERIESEAQLDPKRYGVIVSCGFRKGLLLPDLEGVDTVDEQLSIAMAKGGISPDDDYELYRFTVTRHK